MKNKVFFLVIAFMFLLSLTFISAQPPFEVNVNTQKGLQIFFPQFDAIKQNTAFNLHIHLSNISNGFPLTNDLADCFLHIYDKEGNHTFESKVMDKDSNLYDHEIFISSGNFSNLGEHSFYIWCNNTFLGGEVKETFEVTRTGKLLDTGESLIYFVLAFGVFLLFILSFYFMLSTPYGNKKDEHGAVIQLTKLKYVKLGLILLTWVLFTWFLNILIGLSDNFVSLTMYYGFFDFIFDVMNRLALPLGIIIIVIAFFEIIRDANIYENLKKFGTSYK